jgi:hypothetical protein
MVFIDCCVGFFMRVKFKKGKQKEFIDLVLKNIGCPSLRGLISRGFNVPYSSLKNYYSEERTLPKDLFDNLCYIGKINCNSLKFQLLQDNWGVVKGGSVGKTKK